MTSRPKCIIVTGRPGSGKTTLAALLGPRLHLPVVSRDALKEGYVQTLGVPHSALGAEANGIVTGLFFDLVRKYLDGQISLVIEAAFQHHLWNSRLAEIRGAADPRVIVCALDGEVAARRHLERGLGDASREFFHGDERVAAFRESSVVMPPDEYASPVLGVPTLEVSTADGYVPGLGAIASWAGVSST